MSKCIVVDTNVIILATQGKFDFREITERYDDISISIISVIETLGYKFATEAEQTQTKEFLAELTVLPLTEDIAQYAIHYRQAKRIKLPDASILASARYAGADLLTENTADFRGLDPAVRVLSIADLTASV